MKIKNLYKSVTALLLPLALVAQTENWIYRYNGPGNGPDAAYSIVHGSDGNIYAAGSGAGNGTYRDFLIISLTTAGDTNWVYMYDGPGNYLDEANAIVYGSDGNIYAAGRSAGNGTKSDFLVISLTTAGDTNWTYTYNGPGDSADVAHSIVYGSDGNIYAAGMSTGIGTYRDLLVVSLTSAGDTNWIYTYNGSGNLWDEANSIVYGSDGNIYVAGMSAGSGTSWDFLVVSLTSAGDTNWIYTYNDPGNLLDEANAIVYGSDGNIYAAGYSDRIFFPGYSNLIVVNLTSAGDTNWTYTYNDPGSVSDEASSIVYGADGNIYVAGTSTGNGTHNDFLIISLTSAGDANWVYTYDGPGPGDGTEGAHSIAYGSDGNIYVAGNSISDSYDFVVISLTAAGDTNWVYTYNGPGDYTDNAYSIIYGSDGNIYAAGTSTGIGTSWDFTVISLSPEVGVEENELSSALFPLRASTIFRDRITLQFSKPSQHSLKIMLYNVYGSSVLMKSLNNTPQSITLADKKIKQLPSGIYFLSVYSKEKRLGQIKLIKLQ